MSMRQVASRRIRGLLFAGVAALLAGAMLSPYQASSQGAAPGAPSAPSAPSPEPSPAPPAASPAAPGPAALPTLVPNPGDANDVDEVTLPGKPAAILSGRSTWDDGFGQITGAFKRIEEELRRAALAPAGRPLTLFLETDDLGFRYEAMIPIERAPERQAQLTPDIRFGTTPPGPALRFVHEGPYDDVDSTYETITAYLDAKNIT